MKTHGLSGTKEYEAYRKMIDRCYNVKNAAYYNYGGRGIKVSLEWQGENGPQQFYKDLGKCPDNFSLDRIDNNGDYSKENCRWATNKEQQNNTRYNIQLEYNNKKITVQELAILANIKETLVYDRIVRGWSIDRIVNTPPKPQNKRMIVIDGEEISLMDFKRKYQLDHNVVISRYYKGLPLEDLIKGESKNEKSS